MPTQKQIQVMLEKMTVKDLRILSTYFGYTITKQSGGYKPKYQLVYNLVGGSVAPSTIITGILLKQSGVCTDKDDFGYFKTQERYNKFEKNKCWQQRKFTLNTQDNSISWKRGLGGILQLKDNKGTITTVTKVPDPKIRTIPLGMSQDYEDITYKEGILNITIKTTKGTKNILVKRPTEINNIYRHISGLIDKQQLDDLQKLQDAQEQLQQIGLQKQQLIYYQRHQEQIQQQESQLRTSHPHHSAPLPPPATAARRPATPPPPPSTTSHSADKDPHNLSKKDMDEIESLLYYNVDDDDKPIGNSNYIAGGAFGKVYKLSRNDLIKSNRGHRSREDERVDTFMEKTLKQHQYKDVDIFAIKKIEINQGEDRVTIKREIRRNKTEEHILKQLSNKEEKNSRYFIKLFDSFTYRGTPNIQYFFMELAHQDLFTIIGDYINRKKNITPTIATNITVQLCNAIHVLHQLGYEHLDLKPENIMFTNENHLKLIDFGFGCHHNDLVTDLSECNIHGKLNGTPEYMALEMVLDGGVYRVAYKADWYSVGCIIIELVFKIKFMQQMMNLKSVRPPRAADRHGFWLLNYYLNNPDEYKKMKTKIIQKKGKDYENLIEIAFILMNLDPNKRGNLNTIEKNYKIEIDKDGNAKIVNGPDSLNTWTRVVPTGIGWKMKLS